MILGQFSSVIAILHNTQQLWRFFFNFLNIFEILKMIRTLPRSRDLHVYYVTYTERIPVKNSLPPTSIQKLGYFNRFALVYKFLFTNSHIQYFIVILKGIFFSVYPLECFRHGGQVEAELATIPKGDDGRFSVQPQYFSWWLQPRLCSFLPFST